MCDFFSGIITKEGKVLEHYSDSHETIKKENNLNDNVKDLNKLDFYPFEIEPKEDVFHKPIKKYWEFKLSASGGHSDGFIPKWFSKKHEIKCWNAFKKAWKRRVIQNTEIEKIDNKHGLFLKNCKIGVLINSSVNVMRDNSSVNVICGNSSVNKMYSNSSVNEMCGNSSVNEMYNNSSVNEMYGNSSVNEMRDNSSVKKMYDNSNVNEMFDDSSVNVMYNNSSVNEMRDNSSVNEMCGNSSVKLIDSRFVVVKLFSGKVDKLIRGTILDFTGKKCKVIHKE